MNRLMQWVRGLPLLVHLVGGGLLVQCLALGMVYWGQSRLIDEAMHKLTVGHAQQTAPLLASALANAMAQRDYATLQAIVDEAVSPQGITVIDVFDEKGSPITQGKLGPSLSPSPSLFETTVPLSLGGQLLGHAQLRFSRAAVDALHEELDGWQIVISAMALALAIVGLSLLSYGLIYPLKQLTQATRAMALNAANSANRPSHRLKRLEAVLNPPLGPPQAHHAARKKYVTHAMVPTMGAEIGALQTSFNSMAQAIGQQVSDLRQAQHAAEQASRTKSEFLSKVSHEIRTPMNGVMGMIDLLRDGGLPPAQLELANIAYDASESLMVIINDLLDFSKMQAGEFQVILTPLVLKPQLESVVQLFSANAQRQGLALELLMDPALPEHIEGDAIRLRQILSNLIGNAIKFTATGGVQVSASLVDGESAYCVRITDTGPGIDARLLDSIFEPFVQGDDSNTRRFGGTGLGLSIVKSLCTAMGGSVSVNSTLGRGSEFTVTLPLLIPPAPAPTTAPRPDPAEHKNSAASGVANPSEAARTPTAESVAHTSKPPSLQGMRVLIVEDNETNLLVAESILKAFDCETTSAINGKEALDRLTTQSFDAVLMDCQMPVMDGYEATTRWRKHERQSGAPRLPVLALTADAGQDDRAMCLAHGMDDYLSKPYNSAMLIQMLARHRRPIAHEASEAV